MNRDAKPDEKYPDSAQPYGPTPKYESEDVPPQPKDGEWPDLPNKGFPDADPREPVGSRPPRDRAVDKPPAKVPPGPQRSKVPKVAIGALLGMISAVVISALYLPPVFGPDAPASGAPPASGAASADGAVPAAVVASFVGGEIGALSWGDPHLASHDGLHFDFQAAGEFVAVKAKAGDMEIQARQQGSGPQAQVTTNTAVAMKVHGSRVGFYGLRTTGMTIRIDGTEVEPPTEPIELAGGGHLGPDGIGWRVDWPDGSSAWVTTDGTLRVVLAEQRAGSVAGVLGNANGSADDDLSAADGSTAASTALDATFLYGAFAEGWRVTRQTSLFDYDPGEGPETFADRSAPSKHPTVAGLDAVARANAATNCRQAGVTTQPFLDACILDVALTGDPEFATASLAVQEIAAGTTPPAPAPSGSEDSDGVPGEPRITVDDEGRVHVLWTEEGDEDVIIARARRPDGTFGPDERLGTGFGDVREMHVSPAGRRACASFVGYVFGDGAGGLWSTCFDEGRWSSPALAVSQSGNAIYRGAFDSTGELHVLEHHRPSPILLNGVTLSGESSVLEATLAIDARDGLHAFWYELGEATGLYHRGSRDRATWSDATPLDAEEAAMLGVPEVAIDTAGGVHAAWWTRERLVARSWDPVAGWGPTSGTYLASGPLALAADETGLVAFVGTAEGVVRLTQANGGWSAPELVASSPGAIDLAAAIDAHGNAQIVWATDESPPVFRHLVVAP